MDKIYYYKLNPYTGEISKIEITDYKIVKHKWNPYRDSIVFSGMYGSKTKREYSIETIDLDKFLHNRVISYNSDIKHAVDIIKHTLLFKISNLKSSLDNYNELYYSLYYKK